MANAILGMDINELIRIAESLEKYAGNVGNVIDDVLWNEGAQRISEEITRLLPVSGREWQGKKKAAKMAAPFTQTNEMLAVTVHTKYAYHYLYFPDDGSNTRRHVGNQQFMLRGAENKQEEIANLVLKRLTNIE